MNDLHNPSRRPASACAVTRVTAVLVSSLFLVCPVSWAGFAEGEAAYVSRDYARAMREWSTAAEQGDPRAQYRLAILYDQGQGTEQNIPEALKWARVAAENGEADAQFALGVLLALGGKYPKDDVEAAKWFARGVASAESGNPIAQYRLSQLYRSGRGVERNEATAMMWLNRSAELGNASAQADLGERYLQGGRGVEESESEARKWFEKAAAQGEAGAIRRLIPMLKRDFESAKDDVSAVQALRTAAELDDPWAQHLFGMAYWNGRGIARDPVKACTWMIIAGAEPELLATRLEGFQQAMTASQFEDAQRAAAAWRQAHPKAPIDPRSYQ
jgi:uncharacterized protein